MIIIDKMGPTDEILGLAADLVSLLAANRLLVATAESCTGGRVAAAITAIPGSSEVFGYGIVSYANSAKEQLLGVQASTLAEFGAVSEQTAIEMALGLQRVSGADLNLAITGIAGPGGGTQTKPVGLVWVAIASTRGVVATELRLGNEGAGSDNQRHIIQARATYRVLQIVLAAANNLVLREH